MKINETNLWNVPSLIFMTHIQMEGYKPLVRKGIWFYSRTIKTGKIHVKWELQCSLPGRDAETLVPVPIRSCGYCSSPLDGDQKRPDQKDVPCFQGMLNQANSRKEQRLEGISTTPRKTHLEHTQGLKGNWNSRAFVRVCLKVPTKRAGDI